jgi:catechol 2,3-dioxygenase-like lactoylglutathione lyase family enzyme
MTRIAGSCIIATAMKVERTDFVNIATRDLARAAEFYGETLGLPRNPRSSDEWPEFETGNLTLLLADVAKTGTTFSPSNNAVALRVADVGEAKQELEARGVEFEFDETYDSGVCHMAFFRDPDGNALILHRRHAPYNDGTLP